MTLLQPAIGENILPIDGDVRWLGQCYTLEDSLLIFNNLLDSIAWKREELVLFGKTIQTRRKVAWYGEPGLKYTYSNMEKRASLWTPELLFVKQKVEHRTGKSFNSCLLNLYYSGEDGMGWHSDDEPELGAQPIIASLSLGATRKFQFRHKQTDQRVSLLLDSGTLLLMQGKTQHFWKHQVPKMKAVKTSRINLTFRTIKTKKS
jgi:alkylated DNA repair dioxygenase AlkB